MNQILLFIGLVIILCLTIKPVGKKLPFPTLLIFIALGLLLGVNGPAHIDFSDYALTETVCSTALLFIMFYGGFNTNIDRAKPVAVPAVLPDRRKNLLNVVHNVCDFVVFCASVRVNLKFSR